MTFWSRLPSSVIIVDLYHGGFKGAYQTQPDISQIMELLVMRIAPELRKELERSIVK